MGVNVIVNSFIFNILGLKKLELVFLLRLGYPNIFSNFPLVILSFAG